VRGLVPALLGLTLLGCPAVEGEVPGICDEECADQVLAYGIQWSVMSVFHAATGTLGPVSVDLDCTHGGSAYVSGAVEGDAFDEALTSALAFDMTGCAEAHGEDYDLVLDGVVGQAGTFTNGGGALEFAYTSAAVTYHGSASSEAGVTVELDDTCALETALACDAAGECVTSGTICGRGFEPLPSTVIGE
jgi:hypothetical protein